jgi:general secretion pathway protein A
MSSLYCAYFRLDETPFSIAPDPRFVYLSDRHREALGHLLFGLGEGGGFVQLTGEVGTGKTTICRTLLCQLPDNVDVALIFNPKLTVLELLQSICEELRVALPEDGTSTKAFVDRLYHHLLDANAAGRRTILIIDEAQNLSGEVLEQIRLLTNLETNDHKLLQVFLIGQPELRTVLARSDLRQLAQRITARYHLEPLSRTETSQYIEHRLSVAGGRHKVFTDGAQRKIYKLTGGVPRLINNLCDRALLGAFAVGRERINARIVKRAYGELLGVADKRPRLRFATVSAALVCMTVLAMVAFHFSQLSFAQIVTTTRTTTMSLVESAMELAKIDSNPIVASEDVAISNVSPIVASEDVAISDVSPTVVAATPEQGATQAEAETKPASSLPVSIEPDLNASSVPESPAIPSAIELADLDAASAALTMPAPPPEPPAPRTLREILDAAADGYSVAASQMLLALWGIQETTSSEELCRRAGDGGLACLASDGSWNKLRGFDLPALLEMRTANGGTTQALLVELAGQDATLYVGDEKRRFWLHEVDRYWTGDFVVLWKPPLDGVTMIEKSHSGTSVRWLREVFARLDGIESDARIDSPIDRKLSARIRDFQRRRGLKADGIVGPETLIHLANLGNDAELPTLSPVRHAATGITDHVVTRLSQLEAD